MIWQRHSDTLQHLGGETLLVFITLQNIFSLFLRLCSLCMCVYVNTMHTKCQLQLSLKSIGLSPQTARGNVNKKKKAHKASIQ